MVDTIQLAEIDTRLSIYRMMQEGRLFEKRAQDLFLEGLVKGTSHLGIGQEAVAAGFAAALEPEDLVFCTYRGHVHTLLRGAPMGALMAELLGRANGICGVQPVVSRRRVGSPTRIGMSLGRRRAGSTSTRIGTVARASSVSSTSRVSCATPEATL